MTNDLRGRADRHRTGAFVAGRRAFLAGAGGVVLALPFLEAIHGRARAAPRTPRRFVVWHQGQGTQWDQWAIPGSSQTDFRLGRILEPLADLRDRFVFMRGIDNRAKDRTEGDGHQSAIRSILCATPNSGGPSIDTVVHQRLRTEGQLGPLRLAIGSSARSGRFLAAAGDPVDSIGDPRAMLDTFFAGDDGASAELERLRLRRRRALDAVRESFGTFRRGLGTEDRDRLDRHAARLDDLETRLASGRTCARPVLEQPSGYVPTRDWDVTARNVAEVVALAFACDVTPVATIEWTEDHDPALFAPFIGSYSNWHEMVHSGESRRGITGLHDGYRYYATHMAYFLQRLQEIEEDGGTLLDSTCVLWSSDFGYGAGHNGLSTTFTLAGSLGAETQLGRCITYADPEQLWGASQYTQANLFTSILRAFGQTDEHFGDSTGGTRGPIPGLVG
ncbi:DUF1552 domain-containing protein [Sandaracinus amylolyticus]|uniref:DUF1552 domain-containing protein n=1 Tax=Sandaracinus amylolyticus TaxID=927083 RepID=UPI001F450F4E|nr:DUF1552 domain-containing protein [Sandaracinus amylolyticus]UJR86197.1 Hypothetical protein I5071_82790 [Sandaracinus amylolyticus]